MDESLNIAMAQINPIVGDLPYNAERIRAARERAAALGAHLVVLPELCVCGYPPEDLVLKPAFQRAVRQQVQALAAATGEGGPALLIGAPWMQEGKLYNAALLLEGGAVAHVRLKRELPNYGVFDERRVFAPGPLPAPVPFRGASLGVPVCEDLWEPHVAAHLRQQGAELLVVPNGSPFEVTKQDQRLHLARARARETGLPVLYVNQVGGQDELVFDGASFVINANGACVARLAEFAEDLTLTRWRREAGGWMCEPQPCSVEQSRLGRIYLAMMTGLRDYVTKSGFPGVLLGLSGGVDSALTAAVATDALGAGRVQCVMLPSIYTSRESLEDAADCAQRLGARIETLSIAPAVRAVEESLAPLFAERPRDLTEENIQSRLRGVLLMALSNKFGAMVLTTGNKSEVSVGYTTLYGDSVGGYSVLKDIYKTTVYELAHWRNTNWPAGALGPPGAVIPERVLTKAPTAELRPNQKDEDSLPPYAVLDGILQGLVEKEQSAEDLVRAGFDPATVQRVERLLNGAEYKRRQSAPGVKITEKGFGRDRRYPIVNHFK